MLSLLWLIAFCGTTLYLAYRRASLARATLVLGALVLAYTLWGGAGWAYRSHVLSSRLPAGGFTLPTATRWAPAFRSNCRH